MGLWACREVDVLVDVKFISSEFPNYTDSYYAFSTTGTADSIKFSMSYQSNCLIYQSSNSNNHEHCTKPGSFMSLTVPVVSF